MLPSSKYWLVAALLACLLHDAGAAASPPSWPAWQRFTELYVSRDGRVIDASLHERITTSEGQSYGLLFALIANDRDGFRNLLSWTQNNLARGDLQRSLPAWRWGRAPDGTWRVLDANPASDADLWISYSLIQAGRLWCDAGLSELGNALAARILREEAVLIPGLGATLLPGPKGFVEQQTWRLNASYLPIQVLRSFARNDAQWRELLRSSERVILASAPRGFAADWIQYRASDGFSIDRSTGGIGSYNAIRVYLWAGMLPASDPLHAKLARQLAPMVASTVQRAAPVESIDSNTLVKNGSGAPGFSAALLPMLANAKQAAAVQVHRARVASQSLQNNQAYYSDMLSLFGLGWLEQRYEFSASGQLDVRWKHACSAAR
jgi:endo-1,4-beta-D-glucanase Y